ncbi:hypothetical protein GLOIN_2v1488710 [Rhizophagus irregularis DAOM 181602=DAOM 197198]|nr:hypothetical protein GLOIN_2v1488710 [Rhizophagus irregularis DAOM 181602=DAOM 197198]
MADVYRDDESKYLKALTAEYPQIAFSKVIKSTSMESSDLFKSQKDLEETLVSLTRKGESTKWSFRSFKEKEIYLWDRQDTRPFRMGARRFSGQGERIKKRSDASECEVDKKVIPAFQPYNLTKEAIEEFDANNRKMANRLTKDDKTEESKFG